MVENSEHISNTEEIISIIYLEMKEKGKQKVCEKILKKYKIEIVWTD
jgi:hypothetical protein